MLTILSHFIYFGLREVKKKQNYEDITVAFFLQEKLSETDK